MTGRVAQFAVPDDVAPQLPDRLGEHLLLETDGIRRIERVFMDTFDGRLSRRDLTLVWEAGVLRLEDAAGALLATADVRRVPAALCAADVPSGPLGERLQPLLGLRAALPIARVRIARREFRVLDDEAKTTVRIVLDDVEAQIDAGRRTPLATRLTIRGVRGYDKAFKRACRVADRDLALECAPGTLLEDAVIACDGQPGGFSSRIDVALDARQRSDLAAVAILTQLQDSFDANLPGALADIDTEFLHDLRVSVRRTRALLRELKGVFPPDQLAAFRSEFKWLQEITGPSRDLDVYLLDFPEFVAWLGPEREADLAPLHAELERRRASERRRMVRALRSPRTAELRAAWAPFVAGLRDLPEDDRPSASRPIVSLSARRIATVYRQMVRMGDAITDDSPPEALHELRKKGKELRYLLEFFAPLFPRSTVEPMIRTLKGLQDSLGRFQDREVQALTLRAIADDLAAAGTGAAALMAIGVLVEHLEAAQARARDEFAERFAPFASKARRKAVQETFR